VLILGGLTGVAYPLVVLGLAHAAFPRQAGGSLLWREGRVVGSNVIGQSFTSPGDFWGRPSATVTPAGEPWPCDAANSGGSNLAPGNPALRRAVAARVAALLAADPGQRGPVPVDLATASGSGLDPHLSPAAVLFQAHRVAMARGLPEATVRALVAAHTEGRQLGLLGEPRVNVLQLNLALDALQAR
jgi:K+-transporting ATPase ATPase C chain